MKGVKCEVANGDNIDAAFKGIFPLKLQIQHHVHSSCITYKGILMVPMFFSRPKSIQGF